MCWGWRSQGARAERGHRVVRLLPLRRAAALLCRRRFTKHRERSRHL
jgi:hypothetical protein